MMKPTVENFTLRQKQHNSGDLWRIFCKRARPESRRQLTREEKRALSVCQQNSVYPLQPGLEGLAAPFPGWSPYMMFPPDRMHTLIGVLEMYIAQYAICLEKISVLPKYRNTKYAQGLGYLDSLLKEFPWKHSVPVTMKHFSTGISDKVPTVTSSAKATGFGSVGVMDSEDVPLLLLQILFCKSYKHF